MTKKKLFKVYDKETGVTIRKLQWKEAVDRWQDFRKAIIREEDEAA